MKELVVESRFTLYDVVKITSRKKSNKTITFYYKHPLYYEYNTELEDDFSNTILTKPSSDYQFAHRRTKFNDISVIYEFDHEDIGKNCISNVSHNYK